MEIPESELNFTPEKQVSAFVLEASVNLMHINAKFDAWFSNLLEMDCQLLYHYSQEPLRTVRQKYAEVYPNSFKSNDITTCNFTSQLTMISWASLNDVNDRIGRPINYLRFRCNLIAITLDCNKPYQEDFWTDIR